MKQKKRGFHIPGTPVTRPAAASKGPGCRILHNGKTRRFCRWPAAIFVNRVNGHLPPRTRQAIRRRELRLEIDSRPLQHNPRLQRIRLPSLLAQPEFVAAKPNWLQPEREHAMMPSN
jgi:hypothetical protein